MIATVAKLVGSTVGFPLQVPDRDLGSGSGLQDSKASKALGPMFVIGQNNPPPGGGRRW